MIRGQANHHCIANGPPCIAVLPNMLEVSSVPCGHTAAQAFDDDRGEFAAMPVGVCVCVSVGVEFESFCVLACMHLQLSLHWHLGWSMENMDVRQDLVEA